MNTRQKPCLFKDKVVVTDERERGMLESMRLSGRGASVPQPSSYNLRTTGKVMPCLFNSE